MQIPDELKIYFWDVPVDTIDLCKHSKYVITRILNEGNHEALIWLFQTYDVQEIKNVVQTARNLSLKTARCWQNYFNLKDDELCCTGLLKNRGVSCCADSMH